MTSQPEKQPRLTPIASTTRDSIIMGSTSPNSIRITTSTFSDIKTGIALVYEENSWIRKQVQKEQGEKPLSGTDIFLSRSRLTSQQREVYERFRMLYDDLYRFQEQNVKTKKK